jgi:general secretion pathway protein K
MLRLTLTQQKLNQNHNEKFRVWHPKKQQGIALITVMLIVALCAIIASQMTTRLQTQMQRSTNISFNQQAYWYAMGAEELAKRLLMKAFKDEPEITHLEQVWAQEERSFPVDFGEISGEITDLQACLNLNALHPKAVTKEDTKQQKKNSPATKNKADAKKEEPNKTNTSSTPPKRNKNNKQLPAATVLEALIVNLNIEGVGNFEAEAMVNALTDWLDGDDLITSSGGAEDNDYASREFPYLAANTYLGSVNELRLIENFTPAVILALTPYVCVIPQNNQHKININTLDNELPELLQALIDSSLDDAQQILSARDSAGYENVQDFLNLPEVTAIALESWQTGQFGVDSEYFSLKANANFNNSYFAMRSILKVDKSQKIQVISRTIGRN